jgi:hypothetical protein
MTSARGGIAAHAEPDYTLFAAATASQVIGPRHREERVSARSTSSRGARQRDVAIPWRTAY